MEHAGMENGAGGGQEHTNLSGGRTEPLMSVGVSETDFAASKVDTFWSTEISNVTENQQHQLSPEVTGLTNSLAPLLTHTPAALCQSEEDDKPQRYSHPSNEPDNHFTSRLEEGVESGDLARISSTSSVASTIGSWNEEHDNDHTITGLDGRSKTPLNLSAQTVIGQTLDSYNSPPTSQTTAKRGRVGQGRPTYPNQSFSALQFPHYLPPTQIQTGRNRSSHSTHMSQSSGNLATVKDFDGTLPTAKTAGNTPIQSPGLFSPTASPRPAYEEDEETHHGTPLLHATHLQAPKE